MATLGAGLQRHAGEAANGWVLRAIPLQQELTGNLRAPLLLLLAATVFVLLITTLNVASLLYAHGTKRRREFAIRTALGASAGHLIRQWLAEGLLLAEAAGGLGRFLAAIGIRVLRKEIPADMPNLARLHPDGAMLLVTTVIALAAGVAVAMIPAVAGLRNGSRIVLQETSSAAGGGLGRQRRRGLQTFVLLEVALSFALLTSFGLLLHGFLRLTHSDSMMNRSHVIEVTVRFPSSGAAGKASGSPAAGRIRRRLAALPGVAAVAATNHPLLAGLGFTSSLTAGQVTVTGVEGRTVSSGYFQALHTPVVRGRGFPPSEGPQAASEVVINRPLAETFWGQADPVGRRINFGSAIRPLWFVVIGEVANHIDNRIGRPQPPEVFASLRAFPATSAVTFVVRTSGSPEAAESSLRTVVQSAAPDAAVTRVASLAHQIDRMQAEPAFRAGLLGLFATIGLLLTGAGIFGVFSFLAAERTREIGTRMALGARPGQIVILLLGEGARPLLAGLGIGLLLSLAASGALRGALYGVPPVDPAAFLLAALIVLGIGTAGGWLPARRAAAIPPATALRHD